MKFIISIVILISIFAGPGFARYEFIPKYADIVVRLSSVKKGISLIRYFVSSFYNKKQSENMLSKLARDFKSDYGNSLLTLPSLKKLGIDPEKEFVYSFTAGRKKIFTLTFRMLKRVSNLDPTVSILKSFIGDDARKSYGYFAGIRYIKLSAGSNGYGFYIYRWKKRLIITNHYQGMIYSYYARFGGMNSIPAKPGFRKLINMKTKWNASWIYLTREGGISLFGEAMEFVDFFREYNPLYFFKDWLVVFSLDRPGRSKYIKKLKVSLMFLMTGRWNKYENFFTSVIKNNSKYIKTINFNAQDIPLHLRVRIKPRVLYNTILSDISYLSKRRFLKSYYKLGSILGMDLNAFLLNNISGDISLFLFGLKKAPNQVSDMVFKVFLLKPYLMKLFLKRLKEKKEVSLNKIMINKKEIYEVRYSSPIAFLGSTTYFLFKRNYVWIATGKKSMKWVVDVPEARKRAMMRKKRWTKMGGLRFGFIPKRLTSLLSSNKLKSRGLYSVAKTLEGFKYILVLLMRKNGVLKLDLRLEK